MTRQVENGLSKERLAFLELGADTGGESFLFEVTVPTDVVPRRPTCTSASKSVWKR